MNLLNNWKLYVILYLIFSVLYNQYYKVSTKNVIKDGALTILLELIASVFCIFLIPFFEIKFPKNFSSYFFFGIAIIFYTLNNRLSTTSRKGIEASTYSIIKQLSTVFMIFSGLLFFKEPFNLYKILGAFLIVFSNVLVFYSRNIFKLDKYILLGIIANICMTIALFIDVNYSNYFNLPIYVLLTLLVPSVLTLLFEKIKIKDIILEYKNSNKISIFITSMSWSFMMIFKLLAYKFGKVILVAPLCSLTVILNIFIGYILLKEKDNLLKKIISSIIIIIGIILIKL